MGTHTGEFAGIPATGRQVRVPYCVVYDLAGDRIRGRVYMEMPVIIRRLGGTPQPGSSRPRLTVRGRLWSVIHLGGPDIALAVADGEVEAAGCEPGIRSDARGMRGRRTHQQSRGAAVAGTAQIVASPGSGAR